MNRNARKGLSAAQQGTFRPVVQRAWQMHCIIWEIDRRDCQAKRAWYERELMTAAGVHSTTALACDADVFHDLLMHFASLAKDADLIGRLASESERRMHYRIGKLLEELSFLECHTVTWDYARAVFTSMKLPLTMEETPAPYLQKVLIALDRHVAQRLAERNRRLGEHLTRAKLRTATAHQAALEAAYT